MLAEATSARVQELEREMANLQEILEHVYSTPTSFSLKNIDVAGRSFPVSGGVGGDHVIYTDFKRRYDLDRRIAYAERMGALEVAENLKQCSDKVGVLVADVSGHQMTDALLAAMLHQAFLIGVLYELETNGHVTPTLFDAINTRFYKSSSVSKYLTMIYGEICENGKFRFISAGHPPPMVYSRKFDRFVEIGSSRLITMAPIGMFPSANDVDLQMSRTFTAVTQQCRVNEVSLMAPGDVLLIATDGLLEHERDGEEFAPHRLEAVVRRWRDAPAAEIVTAVRHGMTRFAPPSDDASVVVIKRVD